MGGGAGKYHLCLGRGDMKFKKMEYQEKWSNSQEQVSVHKLRKTHLKCQNSKRWNIRKNGATEDLAENPLPRKSFVIVICLLFSIDIQNQSQLHQESRAKQVNKNGICL